MLYISSRVFSHQDPKQKGKEGVPLPGTLLGAERVAAFCNFLLVDTLEICEVLSETTANKVRTRTCYPQITVNCAHTQTGPIISD